MKRSILYTLTAVLFLSTFASAQFPKIKIPKIPKVPKVDKNIGNDIGNSIGTSKGKNRQMVIDDGFTFFEATPVKSERIEKYSGYIAKGWTLTGNLRAFGTFPDNSGFKMVVVQNGKNLASYTCAAKVFRKAESPVPEVKNSPIDDYMATNAGSSCGKNESIFVKDAGNYDVQVFAVNGDNDKETLLRTYKIDVREAKMIRPGNIPGVSDFYIQRHAEAPVAILMVRPSEPGLNIASNYHLIGGGDTLNGNIDIYVNAVTETNSMGLRETPYARCFVNGNRVNFLNKGQVRIRDMRKDVGVYARDGKPTEYMSFVNYRINIPIQLKNNGGTSADNQNPSFEGNAGEWKCDLRSGAETIRTFKWTVGRDGMPVEHAEQTSGNVNLHWGSALIDVEFPAGGSSMDKALMPMPNAGLFYGIPWKTEEGKKMAAGVPTKGTAYFVQ